MKKSSENAKKPRMNPRQPDRANTKKTSNARRLWVFRLLTAVLVPVFILGFLELALRVSGYGYPTRFFVKSRINGKDFLIPNDYFSYRVFPAALARRPADYRIPASKPEGAYRIFVLGESAALGTPDWSYRV